MSIREKHWIRLARPDDAAALAAIAVAAYGKYVERIGREPMPMRPDFPRHIAASEVHVLETDHTLGYVIVVEEDGDMVLDNIAVDPDEHQKGYGAKLMKFVEDQLRDRGVDTYILYTNEAMTENLAWYQKCGFVECGRRTVKGLHRVYFRKTLAVG